MRRVITGIGADGRSKVLSDGAPPTAFHATETSAPTRVDGPGQRGPVEAKAAVVHELWALSSTPRMGSEDPTPEIAEAVFEVDPGASKFILTEMGPGLFTPMHHTGTIDYAIVVSGGVELGLEDGSVRLGAGDALLVDGVEHSWSAGPDGCVIATVQVGLAPTGGT